MTGRIVGIDGLPIIRERPRRLSTGPRSVQGGSGIRGVPRNRPIGYTIAPPAARQIWELHKIREESRQLSLTNPYLRAYVEWCKVHVIGTKPIPLALDIPREHRARLRKAAREWRRRWRRHQRFPVGSRGQNLSELEAQALYHTIVDGDCFIVPYAGAMGRRQYQLYAGDALAEQSHIPAIGSMPGARQRALGVDVDDRGNPIAYRFGSGARYGNLGYTSYQSELNVKTIDARRVWHVMDRRMDGTTVRGWPKISAAFDSLARVDEAFDAFIRSMIRRASIGLALSRDPELTEQPQLDDGDDPDSRFVYEDASRATAGVDGVRGTDESVAAYQEAEANAGDLLILDPGYRSETISTGSPSPQETLMVQTIERRICGALRTSPMTLLGDYRGVSYSAGQLERQEARETAADMQDMIDRGVHGRAYHDYYYRAWPRILMEYPEVEPSDRDIFRYPEHVYPRLSVVELSKVIPSVVKAFEAGLLDLVASRRELGQVTPDVEDTIAEWLEQREAMREGQAEPPAGDEEGEDEDDPKPPNREEGDEGDDDDGEEEDDE